MRRMQRAKTRNLRPTRFMGRLCAVDVLPSQDTRNLIVNPILSPQQITTTYVTALTGLTGLTSMKRMHLAQPQGDFAQDLIL